MFIAGSKGKLAWDDITEKKTCQMKTRCCYLGFILVQILKTVSYLIGIAKLSVTLILGFLGKTIIYCSCFLALNDAEGSSKYFS